MFCKNCGTALPNEALFCSKCGQATTDVEFVDRHSSRLAIAALNVSFKPTGFLAQQIPGKLVLTETTIKFEPSSINDWMIFTSDKEVQDSVCEFDLSDVENVFVCNGMMLTSVFVIAKSGITREYIAGGKFAYKKPAEIFVTQVNNARLGKKIK